VHSLSAKSHPIQREHVADPDLDSVARVQAGDLNAFEDLIHRHSRRVYRTLVGVLGNPEEARDAMQETFLKAFQHLGEFQRRSKFSTWLVSIATNTGLQLLRERRPQQGFENERFEPDAGFRPKEIRAWGDDPEQLYSKAEMRALVEQSVMKLPATYRLVLLLRDIEQLPIQEAASALGLSVAAFKTRLLRGRLLLRDALAPHFASAVKEGAA
jgi:RNA polymerase sigma-70 factor (ECF subfamily)